MTRRPKLAIISSWGEDCGNASYTYVLKKEFEKHYDVEVLALDLFLLGRSQRAFRKLARLHIKRLAARLKEFDYVNLQFEAGLYGATISDIYRNVDTLLTAAPNVILTMHRIDVAGNSLMKDMTLAMLTMSIKPLRQRRSISNYSRLYFEIIRRARHLSRKKNVWIKVHTKRERRIVQEMYRFDNVKDYPLAFLDPAERERVHNNVQQDYIHKKYNLPPGAKAMGAFGYISEYKGFEELIRAISILPSDWYLLVVGSQHPMSIKNWQPLDKYMAKLLLSVESGASRPLEWIPDDMHSRIHLLASVEPTAPPPSKPSSLLDRVRFIGNVSDDEFTFMLRNMDAVVLPYLEVGQSMSGVIALAIECGSRLFCSNNLSFNEARRYYGEVYSRFDIGNYIEIAQKVRYDESDYSGRRDLMFTKYNIVNSVELHRQMFEGRVA